MPYSAVAMVRSSGGWTGREVDLDEVEDLDGLVELLRDLDPDGDGPALLLLEEDDEYVAVVRADADGDARSFVSDRRAVVRERVAMLLPSEVVEEDDEEEDSGRPQVEPAGEADLLADLGTPGPALLDLCQEEGLLPSDVITAICERAGCVDVLEDIRGG